VLISITGSKSSVKLGNDMSITSEDPLIAQAKSNVPVGFVFGSMSLNNFSITR
jgi:hypothetical protein